MAEQGSPSEPGAEDAQVAAPTQDATLVLATAPTQPAATVAPRQFQR